MEHQDLNSGTSSEPQAASEPLPPPQPLPAPDHPIHSIPTPRHNSGGPWKWLLGCGCLTLLFVVAGLTVLVWLASDSKKPFGPKIALVYVQGAIMSGGGGGLFSDAEAGSERVVADLRKSSQEKDVKAIVIRVNSPGGSAAASQEIYRQVMAVRKKGIPVFVSMGDLAASGGYYISSAADEIYANNGTLTGSIGVILQTTDMSQLFGKIGLRPEVIKSGRHKDMFSPNRPLTDEERAMAKTMILDIYNQFVDDVLAGRKGKGLTRDKLLAVADGRVLTGRQAKAAHLVDEIGGLQDAIKAAARKVGIAGEPPLWKVKRGFWESLAAAKFDIRPQVVIDPVLPENQAALRSLQVPQEGRRP